MDEHSNFLSDEERAALAHIASDKADEIDGQRALGLLAIADGLSQAAAAESAGLTTGQLEYFLRKFRDQRMDAFASTATAPTEPLPTKASVTSDEDQAAELRRLIDELNVVLAELQAMVPEAAKRNGPSPYSPAGLLLLVRDSASKLTPDLQLNVLRNFQGMTAEDLMDIETWKGMAYMMTYSARFQAGQVKDKVSETINQVVPEPVQPGRLWNLAKSSLDRVTPEFAKQILSTFQDATVDDLKDPDTWKGLWYMISYSLQFQAEQMKERLLRAEGEQRSA